MLNAGCQYLIANNMHNKYILLYCLTSILIFQYGLGSAQSLSGTTGLISIPTAQVQQDADFSFGVNFLNKRHLSYFGGQEHTNAYFVTIGYLPFLEIGLRYTRALHPGPASVGDRMVSVRLKLMSEKSLAPSLVVGAHDFFSTVGAHFNALYLVASKTLPGQFASGTTALHLGYGVDWKDARNHQFVGLFGGVSWSPGRFVDLMLEYDSERVNGGLRLYLLNHVALLVGLENFDSMSGGLSYKFRL